MEQADIGIVGLGVMGSNLALNMADNGFRVAVYNRTYEKTAAFVADAGRFGTRIVACKTLDALANAIRAPRPVLIMVQAGPAVDQTIEAVGGHLADGDVIIDAGNSDFHDTRRRSEAVSMAGRCYIGLGVSGGEEGARYGPSMMAGGEPEAYSRIEHILNAMAAEYEGTRCCALLGPDGAGHFVKTIHNGIEYADMQMIAEVYGIMRDGLGMTPDEMAAVFDRWNEGTLKSYLIEITAKALAASDPDTGRPMVDMILDAAGQKGTGRWSAIESQKAGVPATAIEAAVSARSLSSLRDTRLVAAVRYEFATAAMGDALGGRETALKALEAALVTGKIAAYAQGFAVLSAASAEYRWNLPMTMIARIWRAGCIIRSQFLDTIASGFEASSDDTSLLAMPHFVDLIKSGEDDMRLVVAQSVLHRVPVPALSASLAYLDGLRTARSTANMIQAQRDFFGAHGFERIDRDGRGFHGPWAMGNTT